MIGRKKSAIKKPKIQKELSLFKHVAIEDFVFVGFALTVAFLKDILDFVGIGSLPAIGTVVTIIASFAIAGSMFIAGANKKIRRAAKAQSFAIKRIGTLLGGTLIELIFGIDFLPIETLMALYLYRLILLERKNEAEAAQEARTEQESYSFA